MSVAPPNATGTLSKTPLLHVLVSLLDRSSTGTLVLETQDSVRSAIYVERGVPMKARLGEPEVRLSDVLVELGYVDRLAARSTFEKASEANQLHGATLVSEGLISEQTLGLALRSQLVKKLQFVAALPSETVFGFYADVDYLSKWRSGNTPLSPLVATWVLARSRADSAIVGTMTNRIVGHPLRLHRLASPRCFGFSREEQALLDVLRAKPQTLEELCQMGLVSPFTVERMVYALTLTRHLDFGKNLSPLGVGAVAERDEHLLEPKGSLRPSRQVVLGATGEGYRNSDTIPAAATTRRSSVAPLLAADDQLEQLYPQPESKTLAPEPMPKDAVRSSSHPPSAQQPGISQRHAERRVQLEKAYEAMSSQDHFEVLGVERDSSQQTIQESFLKLAKIYHPDRVPEELSALKPVAAKLFARISEAQLTLADPLKRKAYVESLTSGKSEGEEDKVRRVLRAASAFQKAEVLLKKRMLAAAELEANRALEDDPEQTDYLALYAWIQSCKNDSEQRLPELLKMISEAVTRNPANEKNRFYRVQILKRLGRTDEAVSDCRIIVEKNPHHVDALREIRLWEMRRTTPKQTAATRTSTASKGGATHSRSVPPGAATTQSKRSDPPPQGGLLGRLFKR